MRKYLAVGLMLIAATAHATIWDWDGVDQMGGAVTGTLDFNLAAKSDFTTPGQSNYYYTGLNSMSLNAGGNSYARGPAETDIASDTLYISDQGMNQVANPAVFGNLSMAFTVPGDPTIAKSDALDTATPKTFAIQVWNAAEGQANEFYGQVAHIYHQVAITDLSNGTPQGGVGQVVIGGDFSSGEVCP